MNTLEQKIESLEETVKILYSVVIEGKTYIPGEDQYWKAIHSLIAGDRGPLDRFKKEGGIIPKIERVDRRGGKRPRALYNEREAAGNGCRR